MAFKLSSSDLYENLVYIPTPENKFYWCIDNKNYNVGIVEFFKLMGFNISIIEDFDITSLIPYGEKVIDCTNNIVFNGIENFGEGSKDFISHSKLIYEDSINKKNLHTPITLLKTDYLSFSYLPTKGTRKIAGCQMAGITHLPAIVTHEEENIPGGELITDDTQLYSFIEDVAYPDKVFDPGIGIHFKKVNNRTVPIIHHIIINFDKQPASVNTWNALYQKNLDWWGNIGRIVYVNHVPDINLKNSYNESKLDFNHNFEFKLVDNIDEIIRSKSSWSNEICAAIKGDNSEHVTNLIYILTWFSCNKDGDNTEVAYADINNSINYNTSNGVSLIINQNLLTKTY